MGGLPAGGLGGLPAGGTGVLCPWGGGLPAGGGASFLGGLPAGGGGGFPAGGSPDQGGLLDRRPPCGQTDTCKNITFANYVCGR